jgi:twitching motility protein PilU
MFPHNQHPQVLLDLSQYLRAIIAQRLLPGVDGKRVAAVELMLNTPHISELVRKGDVSTIKEAIRNSAEKGIQSFDNSLVGLFKAGRVSMDDALANADSRTNLEARINFG